MTIAEEIRGVVDLISGYLMPHMATIKTIATTVVGLYFFYLFALSVGFVGVAVALWRDRQAKRKERKELRAYRRHYTQRGPDETA